MTLVRGHILLPTISPHALAETLPNYRDIIKLSREGATIHDIAYVAQEAWLRNATIRENILFGEPYDLERYEEVLRICALKPDLRILAAGDMSEVGERGIALSGGQKQRVALARAVYSSRRILLIDDCLSAVDAHTAKHILVECLSGSSRIMQGRTRVLVTHHVAMCLPYAQYMVMINGGRIALKGTPTELRNSNSLSPALIESLDNKNSKFSVKQNNNNKKNTTPVNDRKSEDEYNKEHLQKLAVKQGIDPSADLSMLQGILIKDEEQASKGQIVLDGVDISKIGLEDLRRNVTIIPQDPVLFNGTIRFNLDPFDEHPDELLWEALRRTYLVRDTESQATSTTSSTVNANNTDNKDVVALERMAGIFTTLDAEIKENGNNLSAGQRQLVALARALVRRSKLIIMDEATASVDFDTDRRIQNTIQGPEFADSTLLCIAHRLRTVLDYDKVLVLDNGRVAEYDTPHNLLQIKDGIFRSMCEEAGEYKRMIKAEDSKS
ncbi:hypothetical protein EV177_004135 [Coemansia sp. RSA 1804]|nr:hypothetical protein EV177_004135 [Coemansia sp. RSA 1804]